MLKVLDLCDKVGKFKMMKHNEQYICVGTDTDAVICWCPQLTKTSPDRAQNEQSFCTHEPT